MVSQRTHITGIPYFPGVASGKLHHGFYGDVAECIVLVRELDLIEPEQLPAGFIVEESAPFSHRMIGLLGLGVPTVLVTAEQAGMLEECADICINGTTGEVSDDFSFNSQCHQPAKKTASAEAISMQLADGEPIKLSASVRHTAAAEEAQQLGASSIGLVRSEFLQPTGHRVPDKAFYLEAIGEIAQAAGDRPVSVRLLDVAADKIPGWFQPCLMAGESAGQTLGLQGVRLYNTEPVQRVIDAQLAALAELSGDYQLRVILPYIVRLEEYEYWLKRVRQQLPPEVPVGTMAETPASVLDIHSLLESADFVAIGCNDLMQSVFAADRDESALRHYLDPYAPVLFRLFRQLAKQAGEQLDSVILCGLLSQMQGVLPVLLGMGYRSFSVDAPFIPHLASIANGLTQQECETLADQVCAARTTKEVLQHLKLPLERHPPFLI